MGKALIIGAGGVASVCIHKCCQNPDVFEEICIASRTKSKCDALKAKLDGGKTKISTAQVNADNVDELIAKRKEPLDDSLQNCVNRLKRREGIVKKHVLPDVDSSYQVRKRDIRSFDRLRQEKLLASCRCSLYKNGDTIDCNQLSSGEFNMLSIVLSVILNSKHQNLLILLDEPEISQHPNWQVGIIDKLDDALSDYGCHFLIATHCHYLVSNLPLKRSNLMMIEEKDGREPLSG